MNVYRALIEIRLGAEQLEFRLSRVFSYDFYTFFFFNFFHTTAAAAGNGRSFFSKNPKNELGAKNFQVKTTGGVGCFLHSALP